MMLVKPSPKPQFRLVMALPKLSTPDELKFTVSGATPVNGLAVIGTRFALNAKTVPLSAPPPYSVAPYRILPDKIKPPYGSSPALFV